MKTVTAAAIHCKFRNRPDAACGKLHRCRACGRVLYFVFADRKCSGCADDGGNRRMTVLNENMLEVVPAYKKAKSAKDPG